ncbi:TonB-dependent receptor [uncultured Bacteroides sp.]|uniref:SusC/RagA family TonB-linked outer membrane protein n=1 Tax=Bacteroides congonensis TaxID=1871006 RepID=UPI00258AC88A|nr:TonB-dependent receptor [uncultured Bacteroides sp.]
MKNILYGKCSWRRKIQLFLLITLLHSAMSFAQERTVTGVVVDEKDEPIIGANVKAKGASKGTITDLDGKFILSLPNSIRTLEVSFIGFNTKTVSITDNPLHIKLDESSILLDEVVSIGYGTAKKGNITGSIAKIDAESLEDRATTNIASALQGQLAGVEVRTTTGEPGSELQIRIRGAASINASSDPLYVIDGIPADDLGSINPSDIQSIEVLKDASSSAIYGSRGANGVVLITTKQAAQDSKVRVQFQASYGVQSLERKLDVLSPEEWIDFRTSYNNQRYLEKYASMGATANDDMATRIKLIGKMNYNYVNDDRWTQPNYGGLLLVDWQDEFFRLAPLQNYQLSISSGRNNTKYRVSLGYVDQQGIAITSGYKRLTLRANIESKILNRITIGFNLAPSATWSEGGRVDGKDQQANNMLTMCPIVEPASGLYTGAEGHPPYAWTSSSKVSPIANMEQTVRDSENARFSTSAYVKADIWNGLSAELTGSYNFNSSQSRNFKPSNITSKWSNGEGYETTGSRSDTRSHKFLLQALLKYNRTFDKHTVSGMAGYSMESSNGSSSNLSAKQFPDNALEIFDMQDVVMQRAAANLSTPSRLLSYFGRAQYEYDDRYLLTASIRRDGSSRFGKNSRWGIFPAISAAYRISNENFWSKDFIVNSLKIRASWGMNGNNSIPSNASLAVLDNANYTSGGVINGFAPISLNNQELGWEKTDSWNIALDMGLFKNRIFISADYYIKTTKDLLYKVNVPALLGFTKAWGNIGSIRNKGFEVELSTKNLVGKLKWNTSFNIGYNQNKVISLGDDNSSYFTGFENTQVFMVGQPVKSFYLYDAIGVYQTQADLKKYPVMQQTVVGDVRFRDTDGNGYINDNDRTLVGKPDPDFTFGMTNTFKYKNFDLSILITGQTGGKIYGLLGRAMDRPGMGVSINVLSRWKNMWRSEEEPGDGKTPGIGNSNTGQLYDTRWLYSSDFIKIKNITLGYKLPLKKIVQNARVYVTAENLLMWDKYDGGFSPESSNGSSGDYDYGAYPQARVISLGINVTF